jgi:hypothetical protein
LIQTATKKTPSPILSPTVGAAWHQGGSADHPHEMVAFPVLKGLHQGYQRQMGQGEQGRRGGGVTARGEAIKIAAHDRIEDRDPNVCWMRKP